MLRRFCLQLLLYSLAVCIAIPSLSTLAAAQSSASAHGKKSAETAPAKRVAKKATGKKAVTSSRHGAGKATKASVTAAKASKKKGAKTTVMSHPPKGKAKVTTAAKAHSRRQANLRKHHRRATAAPAAVVTRDTGTASPMEKQISSRSAIIIDAQSGEELFAKYPDNPRQPASTIKIVTAMIALKSLKPDDLVDVTTHAAGMPCSKVFLNPSKQYRANDLINSVLLASANDAAVALGEKIAGSEDKFANLMTISARMWGARDTVCRTASGLTAVGQQTTARDLAHLFRFAMQNEDFAGRVHQKFITTTFGKVLRNHNKALWRLDGAMGGKTGYTVAARQTYVGQFSRDNQTIVVAIMGCETMWADLEKLVNYGFRVKKEKQLARVVPGKTEE